MANEIENKNAENTENQSAEVKPKKKAVAVFNAQYTKQNRRPEGRKNDNSRSQSGSGNGRNSQAGSRRDNNGTGRSGQNHGSDRTPRRDNNTASQNTGKIIRPRPVEERSMRPISERTAPVKTAPAAETPAETAPVKTTPAVEKVTAAAVPAEKPVTLSPAAEKPVAAPAAEKPAAAVPAEKPAPAAEKPAVPAEKPAAEKPAVPAEKPAAEKSAVPAEKPAAQAEKPAPAAEKPASAPEKEEKAAPEKPAIRTALDIPTIEIKGRVQVIPDEPSSADRSSRRDNRNKNQGDRRNGQSRDNRQNHENSNRDNNGRNGERNTSRDNRENNRDGNSRRDFRNDNRDNRENRDSRNDNRDFRNDNRDNRDGNGRRDFRNDNRDNRENRDFRNDNRDNRENRDSRDGNGRRDFRNDNRSRNNTGDHNFRVPDKDKDSNERFSGSHNGNSRGNGPKYSKDGAAPAADDMRGKESRERGKRADVKHTQDHDKLGKKQENYINLEKHGGRKKPTAPQTVKEDPDEIKSLVLPERMTIKELADAMKKQPSEIIKNLFMKGKLVTMNSEIAYEDAESLAEEFNYICEPEEKVDAIAELLKEDEEEEDGMITRPPVVCVMGHVDHGKTSLLDAIRSTNVTAREAGGITQAIGASVVNINGQKITFLDTPGHEAFTAMRMRGANSTDIAVLVVAADDGVMPQTVEAINHAKAAGVEVIVAINKIDKPGANPERVKQELTEYGLVAEDWGGSTVMCEVSAKKKEGIDELLEMILLTADVMELKANPKRNARGLVIEAELDKGRGAVATVLVQKGTLHVGDAVACGSSYGKVRAMIDDKGRRVKEATPSTPVEILGLNNVPAAGETFVVCESDKEAKAFADTYIAEEKKRLLDETRARLNMDNLFAQIQAGNVKELNLIVKADVQGSVEAVKSSLMKLSNEEVMVKVIHGGVGAINESDVILASASNAIIIGFNVRPDAVAKSTAEHENVEIRLYNVIYTAIEEIERKMKGMKDPVYEEKIIGHAEIRQIFKASGVGNIAGSYVMDGVIERGCKVRISREGKQIFEGNLASLKRFKDDVKEVKTNYECGLVFEGFGEFQELDMVEAYKMVEVPQ